MLSHDGQNYFGVRIIPPNLLPIAFFNTLEDTVHPKWSDLIGVWVRLWSDASYLLAAEAQRKDYGVELVSEDVFTYNDQVVKQLAMKTTIKEARQSIQCAWNDDRRSANIFSELASWRLGNGWNPCCSRNRIIGEIRIPDEKPDARWWPQRGISLEERWAYVHNSVWRCFGWGSATLLVTCEC